MEENEGKRLFVAVNDSAQNSKSTELAGSLGLPVWPQGTDPGPDRLLLSYTFDGLTLSQGNMRYTCDYSRLLPRIRPAALKRELLVKTAGFRNETDGLFLIDATAGMGEDSFLLAASGFEVLMIEHNPVIVALVSDALERAKASSQLGEVASRISIMQGDSIRILPTVTRKPDVIYLDPMFPERAKSAKVKKKAQLLQALETPCRDEADLLSAATSLSPRKIVVKRPRTADCLNGVKPSYSNVGDTVRFDCYVH